MSRSMSSVTPILLFVYNRLNLTKKVINSLINCSLSEKIKLYVISDGSKNNKDLELVNEVRAYIKNVNHFNQIELIERNSNYGLAKNIICGVSEVLKKEKQIIVLEDDLVLSNNFLIFMNSALTYYRNIKNVGLISGYSFPVKVPKDYSYDIYFNIRPSSWGWAIWKDRWDQIEWDINKLNLNNFDNDEIKKFNKSGNDLFKMLKKQKEGKINSWAIRLAFHHYKKNLYTIYPLISKIKNIGVDKYATHTKYWNIPNTILDTSYNRKFLFSDRLELAKYFDKSFKSNFSYTQKALRIIKNIIK